MSTQKIAIIGAGIAGLTLARKLNNKADVTIFEKSRSHGRINTRYAEGFQFDYGIPFIISHDNRFNELLHELENNKIIQVWNARFVEIDQGEIMLERQWDAKFPHYVGVPKMNQIGKYLAKNLDIHFQTKISKLYHKNNSWYIKDDMQEQYGPFDWIISAIPAPQAAILMPQTFKYWQDINNKEMSACFALMLGFKQPLDMEFDIAVVKNSDISLISLNSAKPQRPTSFSLVILSTNAWANQHIEDDIENVKKHLINGLHRILQFENENIIHTDIHRWRYANMRGNSERSSFVDNKNKLACIGDWCIKGTMEAAFLSAIDLEQQLNTIL